MTNQLSLPRPRRAARTHAQKWGLGQLGRSPSLLGLDSLAGAAALLALSGCGDPIKFPQDLEELRILGVQVRTEQERSWPQEGQFARVDLLVAGPDGPEEVTAALQLCEASESSWGIPRCAQQPFAEAELEPSPQPTFEFTGEEVFEDQRLAIVGVACASGKPEIDGNAEDFACDDDSTALRFSFATDGQATENQVPRLTETKVTLGDQTVDFIPADRALSCESSLQLAGDDKFIVKIQLDSQSREAGETLQVSHFATKGRFERQFSIVDPDEEPTVELDFEPPEEAGPIRIYLVVRDGRGGTSWLSWDVCASGSSK